MPDRTDRDLPLLAAAPSATEQEKAVRTHTMIREHLEADPALSKYRVSTYLQGSYKNSTNVRGDSDVDMGSFTNRVFYHTTEDLPDVPRVRYGQVASSLKESVESEIRTLPRGEFSYWDYRRDVLASLQLEYGSSSVVDGNKAIRVKGNTYRLDADVLACTDFRQYYKDRNGEASYHSGIMFETKKYERVVNFPHQHFDNLTEKDRATSGKLKGCIRIVKRVRNELEDLKQWDRKRSPSFYLESLFWNVRASMYDGPYTVILPEVLRYLHSDLSEKKQSGNLGAYVQANNIFYLFHPTFWNADDAIEFIEAIWLAVFRQ